MFSDEYVLSTVVATPEVKYDNFLRFLLYIGKIVVTSFETVREASWRQELSGNPRPMSFHLPP